MPDSWRTICCVRSASFAAFSVGNPSASSKPFVCRLCVPPSTALIACTVTRIRLASGCCAVSVEAQQHGALVLGTKALGHDLGPHPPGGAELGDLLEQVVVGVPEEAQAA